MKFNLRILALILIALFLGIFIGRYDIVIKDRQFLPNPEETAKTFKAALVLKIGEDVAWPDNRRKINLCVISDDQTMHIIDSFIKMQKEDNKKATKEFLITRLSDLSNFDNCSVLYLSDNTKSLSSENIRKLQENSILSISDNKGFVASGGMIELIKKDNNIRYVLNNESLDSAGLNVSEVIVKNSESSAK